MASADLIRWSGLAALIGGVLVILNDGLTLVLFPGEHNAQMMTSGLWFLIQMLALLGLALITIGLPGVYAREADESGPLGLISFVVTFGGLLMTFGVAWSEPFLGPFLAKVAPDVLESETSGVFLAGVIVALGLFGVGWLLFGVASLRAKVLPRGATILLILGAALFFVLQLLDLPFWSVILGIALIWIGYALWSNTAAEPVPSAEVAA